MNNIREYMSMILFFFGILSFVEGIFINIWGYEIDISTGYIPAITGFFLALILLTLAGLVFPRKTEYKKDNEDKINNDHKNI